MGDEDHTVAEQYASLRAVKIYVLDIFILVDVGMSIDSRGVDILYLAAGMI